MPNELDSCPECGALPVDWVDNPSSVGHAVPAELDRVLDRWSARPNVMIFGTAMTTGEMARLIRSAIRSAEGAR